EQNSPKVDNSNRSRSRPNPNRGSDTRSNTRDQPSNFRKNYEDRKRGAPHREDCYICGETTHAARYCPSLRKLSAMVVAEKQQEKDTMQARSSAGEQHGQSSGSDKGKNVSVGMFNHIALISHISIAALASKPASVRPRESLFVDAKLNGKDVRIIVDTGATHNFVTEQKAKELGLSYVASKTKLKTVNATPTTVHGFAPKVPIELGEWTGQTDFTIALMDAFDVILGLDFWYEVNAFISPRHNQLHISDTGDEPKTSCVTRYGAFDWLVMPFELTNASTTFCTLMNKLFHSYLDYFVVIYLDDIVVYSNNMEDHVEHLCEVFKVLRDNELYVKREKCSFAQPTVHFLGHTISHGEIRMDSDKIDAIKNWEAPMKVPELRYFLGLANYYCRFIFNYSAIAAPLTDLLKKDRDWNWSEACQTAFERLKAAVTEEPVFPYRISLRHSKSTLMHQTLLSVAS
uniref:CCHC-type domain-containing protein n=1 Tax=Solanum lycopersicum TaxID=4081 RepID=A0A3Q7EX39_SOLLC